MPIEGFPQKCKMMTVKWCKSNHVFATNLQIGKGEKAETVRFLVQ